MFSPGTNSIPRRRRLPQVPMQQQEGAGEVQEERKLECKSAMLARKVYNLRVEDGLSDSDNMRQPLRASQSFRHRPKPQMELRRCALEEGAFSAERRRSTPTVSRRGSLQRPKPEARTDTWPEPKIMSEVEERFLRLPDSDDYTRVRQFKIDAKGAVVSRGDSFRRKRVSSQNNSLNASTRKNDSPSPFTISDMDSNPAESRSTSIGSDLSVVKSQNHADSDEPSTSSHLCYKIYVLGMNGAGKSSLISQFITSEYRNAFADEIEDYENTVSINIGGQECDLIFFEADPTLGDDWKTEPVQAYVLVYSIDRKSSFRAVTNVLEDLRHANNNVPVILCANKIDLERKRAVIAGEVKNISSTYGVAHFDISVALNHDVDDLLIGIVAEIKESCKNERVTDENKPMAVRSDSMPNQEEPEFRAAIRRFSQRKKRQMGPTSIMDLEGGKCTNLSPSGFFEKFRKWTRKSKPLIE
ncbi:hypothetical protein M3Y97_00354900 [Aphelenchoides bicaudatus]|nr:hypothetical protein M3Y97_00354900 [Aphelenchoides bicaudatus]